MVTEPKATFADAETASAPENAERAEILFRAHQRHVHARTDRVLAGWLVAQWLTLMALAWILSRNDPTIDTVPETIRLPLAIMAGGSLLILPLWLAWRHRGGAPTRHVIAISQILYSSLFIHVTSGHVRMEFHVFVSLLALSLYRDWRVLLTATLIGGLEPVLHGWIWPHSIATTTVGSGWPLVLRFLWLALGDIFLLYSVHLSVTEMRRISGGRAALQDANDRTREEVKRQTAQLAAGEKQYRALFEGHPTPMLIFAPETHRVLAVNDAAVRVYGYPRSEFVGLNLRALLAADAAVPAPLPEGGDSPMHRLAHHLTARGQAIEVEYVVHPIRFGGQAALYLAAQDVTRRLQMERLVAAQNEVMMSLAMTESLATATAQVLDLICERFNWELGILWLYDEATGQYRWAGASETSADTHADFLRRARRNEVAPRPDDSGDFWSSGEAISDDEFELLDAPTAPVAPGRDGLGVSIKVPMQSGGRPVGLFEFFAAPTDATARERASSLSAICSVFEQFYERSQMTERLRFLGKLVETSADAIFSVDPQGNITAWNGGAARAYGYADREILGHSFLELVSEAERAAAAENLARARAGEPVETRDGTHRRQDGRTITVNLTLSPIHDAEGTFVGVSCIARDVTEKKRLEGQVSQMQKLESIGQLAAGIAHEINTPTQYVGDNLSFLEEAFAALSRHVAEWRAFYAAVPPQALPAGLAEQGAELARGARLESYSSEIPEAIGSAEDGVRRISQIVSAMKEFSHPGSRDRVDADLNHAIESTVTVARGEWKYWAEVVLDLDPTLPPVPCLLGELNQVVLNLIINASHAIHDRLGEESAERGMITIATRALPDRVELRVTDTGTGIPESVRGRIFDPFFTTKEVGRGTGQGLAIAHDVVVTKHGGRITFETEMGVGTTFLIELPLTAGATLWQGAA